MINKRFLNFKTYAEFDRLKQAGEIRPESIVWIADTNQMWTHDAFYNSITKEQAEKLAKIIDSGDGTKFLTDKLTYETLPDQATVIDIDGKIMSLTNDSPNEDIVAVFGTLPDFTSLVNVVRNPETILNGILVSDGENLGKIAATIEASSTEESLMVLYFDNIKKIFVSITVTNTDGTLSCVREEFGSVGGDTTPEVSISESEPAPGSQEKVFYQVVEEGTDLGVDSDAPADGNVYGRKDNAWEKIETQSQVDLSNYLSKDNTTEFTPDADYEPATKKYVDDKFSTGNSDVFKIREAQISMGSTDPATFNSIKEAITSGKSIIVYGEENSYSIAYGSTANGNVELVYSTIPGVLTKATISPEEGNPISSEMTILATNKNVLTKDNSTEYTPTSNYNPATKKYVDDNILSIVELECNPDDGIDELEYQTILKEYSIALFKYKGELCYKVERDDKPVMADSRHDFTLYTEHYIVLVKESDLTITETITPDHKVLSESQYTALGEAVNTDGILYFVTPDA